MENVGTWLCPMCGRKGTDDGHTPECTRPDYPFDKITQKQQEANHAPTTDDATALDPNAAPLPERVDPESGGPGGTGSGSD